MSCGKNGCVTCCTSCCACHSDGYDQGIAAARDGLLELAREAREEELTLGDLLPADTELVGELREAIRAALAADLGEMWRAQNPGAADPSANDPLTVSINHRDVLALAAAAATAAARRSAVVAIPLASIARAIGEA